VERVDVDDPDDPRLSDYVGLRDADLRRPDRAWFISEGAIVIRQLLRSAYPVRSVLLSPKRYSALADDLGALAAPVYVAGPDVLNAVVGFDLHRGALASADRLRLPEPEALLQSARLVAIVEGINDHENLGALFRNAAAFAVDAVLLSPTCCDPLYRRSVRVSMGHVLHVPFSRLDSWPGTLSALRHDGWRVLALTPERSARSLDSVLPDQRTAILVGAEDVGLSTSALDLADDRVRIPMADGVDSLNVATAAAVAFHHLCSPRRSG
jgi:tRNA G18 (ribose-2'-O)-methylase SpoU